MYEMKGISSSPQTYSRLLNETIDNAKEKALGMKQTVQDNMALSIALASTVFVLLILCCYLKRKYSRSAQVISRREYKKLLKDRQKRQEELHDMREHDDRHLSRDSELGRRGTCSLPAEEKKRRTGKKSNQDPALANSSMESNETMMSQEEVEFVGNSGDVENGDQGFEVGVSPIKASKSDAEDRHYLRNDALTLTVFDNEDEEANQTQGRRSKFTFSRKKKERQGSF